MFPEYILLAIGVTLIVFAFWVSAANNFLSKLVFNIAPFFMGSYIVIYSLVTFGYIAVGGTQ